MNDSWRFGRMEFNAPVLKTGGPQGPRGFESLSLRTTHMEFVAQQVERQTVNLVVVGSSPINLPK